MRPIAEWKLEDLQRLQTDEVPESLTLDYKASATLKKNADGKKELAKDVSSFANSAGGRIVIGMTEVDNKPAGLDAGVDENEWSRESIEQIIDTSVTPRIVGLLIQPISLGNGRTYYVIDIPQAIANAPHQVKSNKKYHKRLNFTTTEMEDYEIRDAMRRSTVPNLYIDTRISEQSVNPAGTNDLVTLYIRTRNESDCPAEFAILKVGLQDDIVDVSQSQGFDWQKSVAITTSFDGGQQDMHFYKRQLSSINHAPLFREEIFSHGNFILSIPDNITKTYLVTAISCPGCLRTQGGHLEKINDQWVLEMYGLTPE